MKPGDVVVLPSTTHYWRITGVYLGVVGQQDIVGLEPVGRTKPIEGERVVDEMLVPIELVKPYVYSRTRE